MLWTGIATGWAVVAAGLWHGLRGPARKASMTAHVLTLGGIVLLSALIGYGLLQTMLVATAGWWALAAVTLLRPERLVDPERGGLGRLAAWLGTAAGAALALHHVLL